MAVARTEDPGLSRFVLPIAGLIALGLCGAGILVLLDPQGGPNLLASIYDALGNRSGALALRNGTGRSARRQDPPGADRARRRRRWHLAAVHRRRIAGQPVASQVARPDPSVGLRRPGSGPSGDLPGLPRGGDDHPQLHGQSRAGHAPELPGHDGRRVRRDPAEQRALARSSVPAGSVGLGLVIAGLFDRVRRESLAKTIVFLPLAISLVGASVIWGFVYAWEPVGQPQIGLLNAIVVGLRWQADPLADDQPDQRLLRDRDPHLAPDRFRHGRAVGFDQGRVERDHRGGPARWRVGAPGLHAGDRADDPRLDHHGRRRRSPS